MLLAVAGGIAVVWAADPAGVPVVGPLPTGLPMPAVDTLAWGDVASLAAPALGVALVAFADTGVLSRAFAARTGQDVDPNREMAPLGAANLACGVAGGFPVSGSSSRTPVAQAVGARTQVTGVVGAAAVALVVAAAPGFTRNLPVATLAAVVIAAVLSVADVRGTLRLLRMRPTDFALSLSAFAPPPAPDPTVGGRPSDPTCKATVRRGHRSPPGPKVPRRWSDRHHLGGCASFSVRTSPPPGRRSGRSPRRV
jgi:MFS superfamily sulfate permease-like transporter